MIKKPKKTIQRRSLLKLLGLAAGGAGLTAAAQKISDEETRQTVVDSLGDLFQDHFQRMSLEEVKQTLDRLERKYSQRFAKQVSVSATPAQPNTLYGYALNLSRCKGYRECVRACVAENNQSRDSEIQYIRVMEMPHGSMNLEESDHYYDGEKVPRDGHWYLPVQCQQCENPPCVRACPVEATWQEPDGIVVIDYDWCIGCRYCAAACPYWARKFNWTEPSIPAEHMNPETHYLSNRPRIKGVMEKCTFCLHRVRMGRLPACQEACPTGARIFGNLLDPKSEIRYIIENKKVFRLKEELNTEPKFWYYTD
ncbi:MAG: 4Fe-4S dicluster domain-containing protein [Acidobacteria bacterium]|nr:4Fe-4S dicluster domain-containing protein [Acidobacteriota bacterium]